MKDSKLTFLPPLLGLLAAIGLQRLGCSWLTVLAAVLGGGMIYLCVINGGGKGLKGFLRGSSLSRFANWRKYGVFPVFLWTLALCLSIFEYQEYREPAHDVRQPEGRLRGTVEEIRTGEFGDRLIVRVDDYIGTPEKTNPLLAVSPFKLVVYASPVAVGVGDGISFPNDVEWTDDKLFFRTQYDNVMESRGVLGSVRAGRSDIRIEECGDGLLPRPAEVREWLSGRIDEAGLAPDSRTLIKMLLLGDRSDCREQLRQQFAFSGVAHVFALSGMHVSIFLGIIMVLLMPLNLIVSHKIRYLLAAVLLWVYCYAVGFPVSAVRATVMATVMLVGMVLERRREPLNALFAAAFVILLVNRRALCDPAFQLSFFCVLCLIAYGWVAEMVAGQQYGFFYKVVSFFGAMTVATLGTWDIVAYHFGTFSPWFAVSNTLILPFLPLYIIISLLYLVSSCIGFPLHLLKMIIEYGAEGLIQLTGMFGREDSVVSVSPGILTVILFSVGIVGLGFSLGSLVTVRKRRDEEIDSQHTGQRLQKWCAVASAFLIVVGVFTVPYSGEDVEMGCLSVRRSLFNVTVRAYDGRGERIDLSLPERESAEWEFGGKKFVLVARNVYNSSARKRVAVPDEPHMCDYLLIDDGYRGGIVDLLRYFEPETIIECRRSVDGESVVSELERLDRGNAYRVLRVTEDSPYVLTLPL